MEKAGSPADLLHCFCWMGQRWVEIISPTQECCVPSLCEDLLSSVDQPLKIARDKVVGKDYLLCDYNRDGDSY
ncbi:hypothetical protein L345_17698, partial [Ophiophagus hannah]